MAGVFFAGWRVVAWDGTGFHVPDSAANCQVFRRQEGAGYPQVLAMALIECGTHAVIDGCFDGRSEQELAERLIGSLDAGMLLLADRNFLSFDLWNKAAASGAQLLWRARADRRPVALAEGTLCDGSYLAVLPDPAKMARRREQMRLKRMRGQVFGPPQGTVVRVVEYTVTVVVTDDDGQRGSRTEDFILVTSVLEPAHADAEALAGLYAQRWESETGYKALKVHQRGPRVILRSRDPQGVHQELWAYLITYQALRVLMSQAAVKAGCDADELSFTAAIRVIRRTITARGRAIAKATRDAITEILAEANGPRRARTCPRSVKRPSSPYPSAKRPPGQKASKPVTYQIKVNQTRLPARA
jgi:predicted kinase